MARRILVIDEDADVLRSVREYLKGSQIVALCVDNCSDGLRLVRETQPDAVLVDASLSDLGGHSVCRLIKREAATRSIPVIIMSHKAGDERDVIEGFRNGADDYVPKPLSLPLLVARLEAVMRRYDANPATEGLIRKRGLQLDPSSREVKVRGRRVPLTRKEFDLLHALLTKPGYVLGARRLLETVWGRDPGDASEPGTVEVHVHYLRKKLGPALARRIVTVVGHGYKFDDE